MTDVEFSMEWRQLTYGGSTEAMELPNGVLVKTGGIHGLAMVFVPGVRISDAHGICLATPEREKYDARPR